MTAAELERLAQELGLDAVGASPVEPYTATEEHIRERRARGLFADLRFTMAQPEVSCHPETLLAGDVVTLEPGLYVPDVGGIRIEHNYRVTQQGCQRLSNHTIALR